MAEWQVDFIRHPYEFVNSEGKLIRTIRKADYQQAQTRNFYAFAYFDSDAQGFRDSNTNFIIRGTFSYNPSNTTLNAYLYMAGLRSQHTVGKDVEDAASSSDTYTVSALSDNSNSRLVFFVDRFSGLLSLQNRATGVLLNSTATTFYFEYSRTGGTYKLDAWTDDTKTTHISGFPISPTLTSSPNTPYVFCPSSANNGDSKVFDCYLENIYINMYGTALRQKPEGRGNTVDTLGKSLF